MQLKIIFVLRIYIRILKMINFLYTLPQQEKNLLIYQLSLSVMVHASQIIYIHKKKIYI